ncbi:glycoside hydrolase family 32 protein [Flavobacterium undicola]|uniref:glycoside hydrolase family 32 protein n=1 Tax=Flavobacterium undicola TaxID=1932779 RepID=UPI0013765D6B|nr:glycoside hydrolase family 32 protein [Flavobacterium undicola]MBA0884472.1 glycoside hydrolase family 32 protein [Flavobacterium undicola]
MNKINNFGFYILCILFIGMQVTVYGQFKPQGKVDYNENFRGQYHFSPKTGWMNDINGLVYQGGKYHMIYQWGEQVRHGGYATSTDLLHWKDEGIALIPLKSDLPDAAIRNAACNEVFSGSAVVVSGKASQKITGTEKEAIVAIYTGTGVGTCLSWSIDSGNTWHDYKKNPVANVTKGADPRDPRVFFHKPSNKWVMAIYEKGTTFYGSTDLINWTFLSNIGFGFECPDIFELLLDGDKNNMKWILMDANGSYLVGNFDGTSFKPDAGQKTQIMTLGNDFYAAQTFTLGSLPNNDNRIIQLAWMDHWNGGLGESIWKRNATFPVSVGLVTYAGQMRITRNPINEIASLYSNENKWDSQIVSPDSNLLSSIKSKQFEIVAEFDLTNTTASKFGFKIANKTVAYHVKSNVLLDEELKPNALNRIKIRMLVDWGQLEVFANEGIYSYSEQFAFSPENNDISLFSDGSIKLVSMEFHEISKIW